MITAWNGLAIRAFAECGATLGRPDFTRLAEEGGAFVWDQLRKDGRLLRTWKDGEAKIHGFLEDHASLGNAFVSLHAATLDARWLEGARWLADEVLTRFRDPESGTVYDTADDAERLVIRPRDPTDSATPSGASAAAELFARLERLTDDERYGVAARAIVDHDADLLEQAGPAFGRMLSVVDRLEAEPVEIAIVGTRDEATSALIEAAHAPLLRNGVIAGQRDDETRLDLPLLRGRGLVDGRPAAFVCRRYACQLPTTDPEELIAQIGSLTAND